ncbi:MAG TPA: sigma-70 family RNA polymerase sigma factor [Dongiaceae bacterium]|nr:sigma-70 family RNA polymerase sigma factor [Dongiaceae bacterium]
MLVPSLEPPMPDPTPVDPPPDLSRTTLLLDRARGGDSGARDALLARFLPILTRWAHRRLPDRARSLADTDDLVQVTLIRALNHLHEFEPRREGAFLAYLRTILLNAVRDEIRRAARRPEHLPLMEHDAAGQSSELERLIGRERLERYEAALAELPEGQREAVMLRLEFGYTHAEIAEALGRPSADAARMLVARGLVDLTKAMDGPDA